MTELANPFRPGAGHTPPFLAGRNEERDQFRRLLDQQTILENMILTGLRGVGKTVLLDSFMPEALERGWKWVGTDLTETACFSDENLAIRIFTDLAKFTSDLVMTTAEVQSAGFASDIERIPRKFDYHTLIGLYKSIPGLSVDKLKGVLELVWSKLKENPDIRGIVFAYDEAQNLADQPDNDQHPLALMLDCFQSLQKKDVPMMLVLSGLPTLFPNLVKSRTFSERMFRIVFLDSLSEEESREAILKPIQETNCALRLTEASVQTIVEMSGGYPYFIQFICREVYDAFIQRLDRQAEAFVPRDEIEQKLDADFFSGRWAHATDRQRQLMHVISTLDNCGNEFSVQEIVEESGRCLSKPFGNSHINQMFNTLTAQGLIYKNRHGKYSFAMPLMARFIRKQNIGQPAA